MSRAEELKELHDSRKALRELESQRDRLLEQLNAISDAAKNSGSIIGFAAKVFEQLQDIRALIREIEGGGK